MIWELLLINQAYFDIHIDAVLDLEHVNVKAITACKFKVVVDAVNSTGGIAIPLFCWSVWALSRSKLHCEPNGQFPSQSRAFEATLNRFV